MPPTTRPMTLCTIRKPFVWHQDEALIASGKCLVEHPNKLDDGLKRSRRNDDDSERSDDDSGKPNDNFGT